MSTIIVAEAGVNHFGSIDFAYRMVDAAKAAGADIVKFQTYIPELQYEETHPNYKIIRDLCLSHKEFISLARHCENSKIEFMSTPGDIPSLKFLVEECGVKRIKIGSDDLTNDKLTTAARETKLPVIVSTGMATLAEIWDSLIGVGFNGWTDLTLLHCVSSYPCKTEDANLNAILTLKSTYKNVGYSDHTVGNLACIVAAAMGATMIEKHFMLEPNATSLPIDYLVSADQWQFRGMVDQVKRVEILLGTGEKIPCEAEKRNIPLLRKNVKGMRT